METTVFNVGNAGWRYRMCLELHLRCLLGTLGRFEVGVLIEAEQAGKDVLGETADGGIVGFGCVVEVLAGHVDAVFRAFELGL